MKFYTNLMSFGLLILILFSIQNEVSAQIFKKIQSDKGDIDSECVEPSDGIYDIEIGVDLTSIAEGPDEDGGYAYPCDLYIGVQIAETDQTFFEPISNIDAGDNPDSFNGSNPYNPNVGVLTVNAQANLNLPCEDRRFTVYVNLYCKEGENYEPYDLCSRIPEDQNHEQGLQKNATSAPCDVSETFVYKFCCEESNMQNKFNHVKQSSIELLSVSQNNIIVRGQFDSNKITEIFVYNINGQRISNITWNLINEKNVNIYITDDLPFGYYFVRVFQNNNINTLKIINY